MIKRMNERTNEVRGSSRKQRKKEEETTGTNTAPTLRSREIKHTTMIDRLITPTQDTTPSTKAASMTSSLRSRDSRSSVFAGGPFVCKKQTNK